MADLVIVVPTRGRPAQLARLIAAVRATTDGRADVLALVDDCDPYRGAYLQLSGPGVEVLVGPRRSLVGWTNVGAAYALDRADRPTYLASLGDDHLPRTRDWDVRLIGAIRAMNGPGWAYGNDLLQGERLPTAWVQHAATVDALGWMMLPSLEHMYADNAVRDVGRGAGRLAYVAGVVIEHMHPQAGKARIDGSYAESNRPEQYRRDERPYREWLESDGQSDAVRAVAALSWAVTA